MLAGHSLQTRTPVYDGGMNTHFSCQSIWVCNPEKLLGNLYSRDRQDSRKAQFHPDFFPVLFSFPAIVAICLLVGRILRPLLPHRPLWATTFTKEFGEQRVMVSPDPKQQSALSTAILLGLFLAGLVLRLVTVFYPSLSITVVAPAISWVTRLPENEKPIDIKIRPYSLFSLRLNVQKPLLLVYLR